jgi:LPPG:FO 2-phospho-L-lactate transferase
VRLPRATVQGRPLLMTDRDAAADIAGAALDLALQLAKR